jgi:hypothetical protein
MLLVERLVAVAVYHTIALAYYRACQYDKASGKVVAGTPSLADFMILAAGPWGRPPDLRPALRFGVVLHTRRVFDN